MMKHPLLVTGCAGFIGMSTTKRLLQQGETVVGVDNLNNYYDQQLKLDRLAQLTHPNFHFHQVDISDMSTMGKIWEQYEPQRIIHLAAQAGVRYSLDNPFAYIQSNILGFLVILELCRHKKNCQHLVYASSSSVYGANTSIPFQESDIVRSPISLYAATKGSNELMAQSYHHLYSIPLSGLRFFTVYGPWGRPDMAYFKFTKAILERTPLDLYNKGNMKRDFTYIDDIVDGIIRALEHPPKKEQEQHPIYNLGNHKAEKTTRLIDIIEAVTNQKALINHLPQQPGDVIETYANIDFAQRTFDYSPQTSLDEGLPRFITWYQNYLENKASTK